MLYAIQLLTDFSSLILKIHTQIFRFIVVTFDTLWLLFLEKQNSKLINFLQRVLI